MTRNLIKKFKLLLQITVLLFQISSCWAEWITYNTSDGLVSNDIYTIAIDTSGNIWFGTNGGGISVFAVENNWKTINSENSIMAGNIIYTIAIDTSGYKWFGTNEGAYLFEGGEGDLFNEVYWSSYTTVNSGISADIIEFITVDAFNNKWFGTRGGGASVFEVEEGTWTSYGRADSDIGSNNINTICTDYTIYPDTPTIWFGTGGGGLSKFEWNGSDSREWTKNYTTSNSGLAETYVMTIAIDKNGRKWIGTQRFGVSVLEQDNWFTYDKSNSGLQDNNIKAIVMDDLGAVWIGTGGGGISKFDGNSWATYNTENSGLVSNFVRAIAIDKQGNKWFGTENGVSFFIERDIEVPKGEVRIQGGVRGYVNPDIGEKAKIYFSPSQSGRVTVKIYTLNGHLVWNETKDTDGEKGFIIWDCKNKDKIVVSSGVYIVYVKGPGIDSIKKVAIIK